MENKNTSNKLRPGYRIGNFSIQAELGRGGFGITYFATHGRGKRHVAIKEYSPPLWAERCQTGPVRPRRGLETHYRIGLERFLSEADVLSRVRHPNIVGLIDVVWVQHAPYLVMEYIPGLDLLAGMGKRLKPCEAEFKHLVWPLLDAVEHLHWEGYIHRDIKPHNILIRDDGTPTLLDFGSARYLLDAEGHGTFRQVTPGYAAREQYDRYENGLGPWTDIYSLGATFYHALTGRRPSAASVPIASLSGQERLAAETFGRCDYTPAFLSAITLALSRLPSARPQNITEWRNLLEGRNTDESATPVLENEPAEEPTTVALWNRPLQKKLEAIRRYHHQFVNTMPLPVVDRESRVQA